MTLIVDLLCACSANLYKEPTQPDQPEDLVAKIALCNNIFIGAPSLGGQGPRPPSDAGLFLLTSAGHLCQASFEVHATARSPTR